MGSLFDGEKYLQLYATRPRSGATLAACLFLAVIILLPTFGEPNHLAGFIMGLIYALTVLTMMVVPKAISERYWVTRLYRIGDTLHVELRSFPGFHRGFSCHYRDAFAWNRLGSGWRDRLVFYHEGKRYMVPLARSTFDAPALVAAWPELASGFGIRAARPMMPIRPLTI